MKKEIKEKIELIKNKKIPKNYHQNNRELLPDDWEVAKIDNVMNIKNNYRVPISESERKKIQGIYPYYGPTKIQDYINQYNLEGEHVLIGEDGDHFLKYKEKSMTLLVDGKFNVNNHAHILQGTNLCNTKWFYYSFQYKNILSSVTRQGVGRYKLTKEALKEIEFSLPKIEEQRKIINIIEVWDRAIGLKQKLFKEKLDQKKGLMERFLAGKVRLKGFNDKVEIKKLKNYINEIKVKNKDNKETRILSVTNRQGFILQEEKFDRIIASSDVSNYKIVKKGEFAYNPSRVNVGSLDLLTNFDSGLLSPMYVIFECNHRLDKDYLYQFLKSDMFLKYVPRLLQGSVRDSLSFESLQQVRISMPKVEEQEAIANILKTSDKEIKLLGKEIELLKEQKKGLMQLLLTGIVRV
ncbi:TPA: restriction endonuclease subunit S [Clostridioides difficile]|uniref:restriction endonuclease subunit S n=1 Tax=Clostridioides difficile TaxID=1496 RepID=UPI001304B0BB|nr:restriction endonuclease subunit S [Clostridioides difficile]MCB4303733.1 restriction endonuclease subunit S [Clostridioides difficile]MCW0563798.1 restriction endonuclease subunit S [Clostridioides difficile]MDI6156437.1 restriction endonuclease subunit S [Clostridioides difficile]HBE9929375.1 restriction endonuclease subunit S [Clostridioides difficile]HBG7379071.1 restriction endonuclease subunit S [Clostridioides difficile]